MFGDPPFPESVVGEALADAWGMSAAAVEYAQIGYGSHHWYVTDDRGGRWLVTADRADGQPVAAAYRLAHSLGQRFDFVRAPLPCQEGAVVLERVDRLISLWPWVEGRSGAFGDDPSPDDVAAVSRCLRMLHDYSEVPVDPRLVDDWGVPGRAILEELLDEPIASLDICHQIETLQLIQSLTRSGKLAITALHDLNLAARYCDRLILIGETATGSAKTIIADGSPEEVLNRENLASCFAISADISKAENKISLSNIMPLQKQQTD